MLSRARSSSERVWREHRLLVLILAYAAVVGSWGVWHRGALFIDEGYQHLEGIWVRGKISYLLHHFPLSFNGHEFVLNDRGGLPLAYAKPMHDLLIAIASYFGHGATPVLVMENLFGLATIVVVYLIALRLWTKTAANASAAVLATSVYFLAYRRSELPEMDSVFFFCLAVLLLLRATDGHARRRIFGAGIAAGLCFTSNDRWYIALPLLAIIGVILLAQQRRGMRAAFRGGLIGVGGFLIPPALFELMSTALVWIGSYSRPGYSAVTLPYQTYFQRLYLREQFVREGLGGQPRLSQLAHEPYTSYLRRFDGHVWVVVLAVTLIVGLLVRKKAFMIAIAWAAIPFLFAASSANIAPRFISLALPGFALLIGGAFEHAWKRERAIAAGSAVLLSATILSSILHTPGLLRVGWGLDTPLRIVAREGGGAIISTKAYPAATTAGIGRDGLVGRYFEDLAWAKEQRAHGARWLLLEVWVPKGTAPAAANPSDSFTPIGPVGPLSLHFLRDEKPLWSSRAPATAFAYEGIEGIGDHVLTLFARSGHPVVIGMHDRLLLLYDLPDL